MVISEKGAASALALGESFIWEDRCVTIPALRGRGPEKSKEVFAVRCSLQSGCCTLFLLTVGSRQPTPTNDAWVFCPKKESLAHRRLKSSTTSSKSQTSESHKSKFSPQRDIHNS